MLNLENAGVRKLYPFRSNFFSAGGVRMHYLDEGPKDAPAVMMLHGNPTWSFYYRELAKALSSGYRVIVPDHVGCGLSDKPARYRYRLDQHIDNVLRLRAHLDLRDIIFVVHDWGGAIGMGAALSLRQFVRGFVVMNTAAFRSDSMHWLIRAARIPAFGALSIRGGNMFARTAMRVCTRQPLSRGVRRAYLAPYGNWRSRVAQLRFVQDIPMGPKDPSYATLERIEEGLPAFANTPMLLLWGARDFVFHEGFLEEWRARFPQAEVVRYPDAGHLVLEDAGLAAVSKISDFVDRAYPAGRTAA